MKTNVIKKTIALALILSTILAFCSCAAGGSQLKDAIEVSFNGPDGHAKASMDIDYDSLNAKIDKKKANKYIEKLSKKATKGMDSFESAFASLDFSYIENYFTFFYSVSLAEDYKDLKNGDTVIVNVDAAKRLLDLGETLKDVERNTGLSVPDEISYKVSDLTEAAEIDLFSDTSKFVKFSGANGHGKAEVSIDEAFSVNAGSITISAANDSYKKTLNVKCNDQNIGSITLKVEEESDTLAQGEKVTVIAEADSYSNVFDKMLENGYVLKSEKAVVTVPDLGQAKEFDLFSVAGKYLHYKGANGFGSVSFDIPDDAEFEVNGVYFEQYWSELKVVYDNKEMGNIGFAVQAGENLTKDDKISIELKGNALDNLAEVGVYPKEKIKEFTVPDLGEFINDSSELTPADIDLIKDTALKYAAKKQNSEVTLVGIYFCSIKGNASHNYNAKGMVTVVYSYPTILGTWYAYVDYYDISKNTQGELNLETVNDGGLWDFVSPEESLSGDYTYEKIG